MTEGVGRPGRDGESSATNPRRPAVVLLGASNLTMGLATVVAHARGAAGGPVDVYGALGHGRSYGIPSQVFGRTLPGIDGCGLWAALAARGDRPAFALVTDVGNDLLYGESPATTLAWAGAATARLAGARIVVARPPVEVARRAGAWQFLFVTTVLVPGRGHSREALIGSAEQLDAGLGAMAARHGAIAVDQHPDWYGFDPIHYRRGMRSHAWAALLASWGGNPAPLSWADRRALWAARAAQREVRGRLLVTAQPSAVLADGSCVHLY